jgi:hypothetical protein
MAVDPNTGLQIPQAAGISPAVAAAGDPNTPAGQRAARQAQAQQFIQQYAPAGSQGLIKHPVRFMHNTTTGEGGPLNRLLRLRTASNAAGYGQDQNQLSGYLQGQLGKPVNEQQQEAPMLGQLSSYLQQRRGVGLTPAETSAIQGQQQGQIEGSTAESARLAGSRLAASGIDPRSGLGATEMGKISRGREQDLADMQRNITLMDLARKQQIEGEAAGVAGQEQQARQFDVSSQLGREGTVESGLNALAGLNENQRQADLGFTQGLTEAQLQRAALERAAKLSEPSTLENVGNIAHGLFGGLTGGGGGGGGGI